MRKREKLSNYRLRMQAKIANAFCREQAIECGYAALASAIEGKAWERHHYINLMRRFMMCAKNLGSLAYPKKDSYLNQK